MFRPFDAARRCRCGRRSQSAVRSPLAARQRPQPGGRESPVICAAAILLRSRVDRFGTHRSRAPAPALHRFSVASSQHLRTAADSSQSRPARATRMLSWLNLRAISDHWMRLVQCFLPRARNTVHSIREPLVITMFTGLIEHTGTIEALVLNEDGGRITIHAPSVAPSLAVSNSVAVNGSCLTIVDLRPSRFSADLSPEPIPQTSFPPKTPPLS